MALNDIIFSIVMSVAILAFAGNAYYQKRKSGFVDGRKAMSWYYRVLGIAMVFFLGRTIIDLVIAHH